MGGERSEISWQQIVGESAALKRVLHHAAIVADTDSTVLISGETGTGKELLARLVHSRSARKDASFIKVSCAAIPTERLESEIFGHEKGAFREATCQYVGKLELADKGTLLLDDVGDLPLNLQPKLLGVLLDREFERIGGTKTIPVDVRLIAGHGSRFAGRCRRRAISRRPVLPPARVSLASASAARPPRGYSLTGPPFRQ